MLKKITVKWQRPLLSETKVFDKGDVDKKSLNYIKKLYKTEANKTRGWFLKVDIITENI